jgi:spermidine/putrescine transport system substrate-binding protein
MSRRQFVERSGRVALLLGLGGAPLAAACGGDDDGGGGGGDGESAATIPLARLDAPITLPDNSADPIASGADPETGTLRVFTYPDYLNPETLEAFAGQYGIQVEESPYETEAQLLSGLQNPSFTYDVVVGATTLGLPRFVVGDLIQPLNHDYLSNFGNVLPSLQDPYYDQGSKYSIPYVVYTTGVAYRRDVIDESEFAGDDAWGLLWDPSRRGYVGIIDDARDGLTLGMYYRGVTDTNTEDQAVIDAAAADIRDLVSTTSARIDILAYQTIPEGRAHINQAWSGDMLAAQYYLPEGTGVDVLGYWAPERTTVANDFFVVPTRSERPVLAHLFIDFLLDPANAQLNFEFVGYQPALAAPSPDELIAAELVPAHLVTALVSDAQVESGYRLDALAPDVQQMWEDAWQTVKAG